MPWNWSDKFWSRSWISCKKNIHRWNQVKWASIKTGIPLYQSATRGHVDILQSESSRLILSIMHMIVHFPYAICPMQLYLFVNFHFMWVKYNSDEFSTLQTVERNRSSYYEHFKYKKTRWESKICQIERVLMWQHYKHRFKEMEERVEWGGKTLQFHLWNR